MGLLSGSGTELSWQSAEVEYDRISMEDLDGDGRSDRGLGAELFSSAGTCGWAQNFYELLNFQMHFYDHAKPQRGRVSRF